MISQQRLKKEILSFSLMLAFGATFYFGIQALQNYNGKRAFASTGLTPLTLAEAKTKAAKEGKPVLADLSAFWCGYCVKLDKTVLSQARVKALIDTHYVYARIDSESDEAAGFMQRYNASGYPTLVIIQPDGRLIKKLNITFEPEAFISQL